MRSVKNSDVVADLAIDAVRCTLEIMLGGTKIASVLQLKPNLDT